MKMPPKLWLPVIAFVLIAAAVAVISNPLRRSDEAIRTWLLNSVPAGSSIEHLTSVAGERGWRVKSGWDGTQPQADWGGIDGAHIVWVYLGGYRNIFRTDLDSFWSFDENGRLVDVKTRRMTDAL